MAAHLCFNTCGDEILIYAIMGVGAMRDKGGLAYTYNHGSRGNIPTLTNHLNSLPCRLTLRGRILSTKWGSSWGKVGA